MVWLSPFLYDVLFDLDDDEINQVRKEMIELQERDVEFPKTKPKDSKIALSFNFDPNKLPLDSMRLLGIPNFIAERIVKYRNSGGTFRESNDLSKIYGMHDSLISRLKPLIKIEVSKQSINNYNKKGFGKTPEPIDLNLADSASLTSLRGIGPVFAQRITKYRAALGGYIKKEQLLEVYGVSDSLYLTIESYLMIDEEFSPEKININEASVKDLRKHPYLRDYNLSNNLVQYRNQHGDFRSIEELNKLHTMKPSEYNRVQPYLKISE